MGRPAVHDADGLLDAAALLAATAGPTGVTMTAVAREAGAPSGSVYHRFPNRSALLAALWLRALERFHEGFIAAITGDDAAIAAESGAGHIVAWCRDNPHDAAVLLYKTADFDEPHWPTEQQQRLERMNRRVMGTVRELTRRLGLDTARGRELIIMIVLDLPYSVVRRHLRSGTTIPRYSEQLIAESVRAALAEHRKSAAAP
ncbi:TetR/AcrR family transcriptional regulator [Nocardia cyriacigeorgica]|uniref:TetR/AcrR family transcriptional regulator n=1 Tax=Nocardia cyriacigeorgica TaxID=135487 RepID=A0ABX0CN95_9NOCA|nr:TetR/AcrR family transcriptional regulator [Nocardia cyriacigeorgica]NEW57541.1 TetR/AcrR family transcriptional regulator [Nocardia cyriacigeorgica]